MTPSASSRSTRRLTAGADSETRNPMLWKERRASCLRSATICRSMSSIARRVSHATQRIGIVHSARSADHEAMSTQPIVAPSKTDDFMPLHGIDHVEFYVGNALQAASYWARSLGFTEVAYAGLETGVRDRASHVLEQGRIRIVLTGALVPGHEIGAHVAKHGDGVKVIALGVPDVDHAYREATTRGARGVEEPHDLSDDDGTVRLASIATYGDTLHTFVDRSQYRGAFMPG